MIFNYVKQSALVETFLYFLQFSFEVLQGLSKTVDKT